MMCSADRLNKQGDSRQLCRSPFSILNQSVVPYRGLTIVSWHTYSFIRRQVRQSVFISIQSLSRVQLLSPHGLQLARPPCPSPTPGDYSNSSPLIQWCHPTISSSVVPFSPHLQSFPASWSFQISQFFTSRGQSIGVSALSSVFPMNIRTDFF